MRPRRRRTRRHRATIDATPGAVLAALAPFRDGLVVGCECMFAWYWLADLCQSEQIPFVLGHALYLKLIHGGKSKNDTIDAHKLATLLRGGAFPQAYGAMPSPRFERPAGGTGEILARILIPSLRLGGERVG